MEIESYSDFELVKKRYRELALLYHPDKNPKNKHAEEYFKILTQGYKLLGNPIKKRDYDALLKNYYATKSQPEPLADKREQVRAKMKRHQEKKRLEFIEKYVSDENDFPHKYRFILAVLFFVSGILMCYNHWFINFLNFNIFYIVVGSFLFGLGCYLIAENIFQRRSFKKAMLIEDYVKENGSARIFAILFFITPFVFLMLMSLTKTIHLTYFYDMTIVKKVEYLGEDVSFIYSVNDELISRRTEAKFGFDYTDLSKIRVKYSRINPNISELIILNED